PKGNSMTALTYPAPVTEPEGVWAILLDGELVHIRPLRPDDHEAVLRLHRGLSPEHRYQRFFGVSPKAPEEIARRLTLEASGELSALGAWWRDELIGVAHYERLPAQPSNAEVAFVVAEAAHHRGVATLLLEHLASRARAERVQRFVADVLVRNAPMLEVVAAAGLEVKERPDGEVLHITAGLDAGEPYLEAVGERERLAQKASLRHVFTPASVAVVGASPRPGNVGGAIVRNL